MGINEKHVLPWLERLYQFDLRRIQYHIDKIFQIVRLKGFAKR